MGSKLPSVSDGIAAFDKILEESPDQGEGEAEGSERGGEPRGLSPEPQDEPREPARAKEAQAPAPAARAPETPAQEQRRLALKYKGRDVELPEEDVVSYAQRGFDYDQKMAALKREREAFMAEAKNYRDYEEYRKYLNERPDAGKAIGALLKHVEEHGEVPALDFAKEKVTPLSKVDPYTDRRMRALEEELAALRHDRVNEHLAQQMASAIQSEPTLLRISSDSVKKVGRDIALEKLATLVNAAPGADVKTLARSLATEFEQIGETLGGESYAQRKRDEVGRFRPEPPSGTSPTPGPGPARPKYKAADLKNGALLKGAISFMAGADRE